jgi:nitronate monooxygenase
VPHAQRDAARLDPFQGEAVEERHGSTLARAATVATVPALPRIVLAPLAGGPSTPELAAAVSNAGGLGFVAAGYLSAEELARRLDRARTLTDGPLAVNVFVLREEPVDETALAAYARELEPEAARYDAALGEARFDDDELDAKLDVATRADVLSTTFGCLPAETVARLQAAGTRVWATVTSASEARDAAAAGVDALVVQGTEAGGHSGAWSDTDEPVPPLAELLAQVRAVVGTPLVATGGIATRAHVAAALEAGADAAQIGSGFLLASEAATSEPHRRALARPGETGLTRAFTGRRARGIVNEFMRAHPGAPRAYPHVNHLTAPLRAAARAAGDEQRINLWAGVNHAQAEARPAAEIVAVLGP